MKRYSSGLIIASALFTLAGCSDDDGTENALKEQNRILQEQNEKPVAIGTATVFGSIKNGITGEVVSSATARIHKAGAWSEPVEVEGGTFEFAEVPPGSDYAVEITSTDDSFHVRTFYGSTTIAVDNASTYHDIGTIMVAPAKTHSITVLNQNDNSPVTDIWFVATSDFGIPYLSDRNDVYKSTYNAETQSHEITLPIGLHSDIQLNVDTDNDGLSDYISKYDDINNTYHGYNLLFTGSLFPEHGYIYLDPVQDGGYTADIHLEIVTYSDTPISIATPALVDPVKGPVKGVYSNGVYVFEDILIEQQSRLINVPAFEFDGVEYRDSTITLRYDEEDNAVYTGSSNNRDWDVTLYDKPAVINLTLSPYQEYY